jgi:hypothetical protein
MTAASSINLVGTLTSATSRRISPSALSQIIGELEVKNIEVFVAHGTTVPVPLAFSPGVTEALVLYIYCPYALALTLESSDADDPGPMTIGHKGVTLLTLAPGRGIVSVSATNEHSTQDATLELTVGTVQAAGDVPSFWA